MGEERRSQLSSPRVQRDLALGEKSVIKAISDLCHPKVGWPGQVKESEEELQHILVELS